MTSTALHLPSSATARWSWIPLVVGCELVGILGAAATSTGGSVWYQELATPVFQPPAWLFGPVWTLLYAMMGIAAWRVWRSRAERPLKRWALPSNFDHWYKMYGGGQTEVGLLCM